MRLEIGDIILVRPKSLLSRIISWFLKSDISHVAIVYDITKEGEVLIMDIDWDYSKIRSLDFYNDRGFKVFRLIGGLTLEEKEVAQEWMISNLYKKYDFIQLFSFLKRVLFNINKVLNNPDRFVCSEMADRLYYYIGYDLVDEYLIGEVTPEDLQNSILLEHIY